MRVLLGVVALLALVGCVEKKTDVELFDEGKVKVTLNADPATGYEPLGVSFEAYLENKERVLTKDITNAKWIITGPDGFLREIKEEFSTYQEGETNENDSFYLDFMFHRFGRYTVKLVLNDGEYTSNPLVVRVQERETEDRYKQRY